MKTTTDLIRLVRATYLERGTRTLELRHAEGTESLFLRQGELYLDRDHETAVAVAPRIAELRSEERPAAVAELRRGAEELAHQLVRLPEARLEERDQRASAVELVGPLPTVCFVQELTVHGADESDLVARLGGEDEKLRSTDRTPALEQLPGLEADMAQVMVTLENPATVAEVLRGAGGDRLGRLRGLAKLWAVGLVRAVDQGRSADQPPRTEEILSPKLLATFLERMARELDETAVELPPEDHRVRVAELLSRLGQVNYYELLDIELTADEDEMLNAFRELARLVHPHNAPRLGLEGKEEALRVLFERAAEAYLTLSEPQRRASYNNLAGIHQGLVVGKAQRQQEKRQMARRNYRRAGLCLAEMDYSLAVDLLKEAARMDPQPEYYARLGMAQSKNPRWHHHAVDSFRRALELKPDDVGTLFGFGDLLEGMDRRDEAAEQYRATLELMPDHAGAIEGLERLGTRRSLAAQAKARTGSFRSLFGGSSGAED